MTVNVISLSAGQFAHIEQIERVGIIPKLSGEFSFWKTFSIDVAVVSCGEILPREHSNQRL